MRPVGYSIAGIVLAAGASERMGSPKANLETPKKRTLLDLQCVLLASSGCEGVSVVVGADATAIRERNSALPVEWIENSEWRKGQFSSLIAGVRSALASGAQGAIVLPVDAAGVSESVVMALIETGLRNPHLDAVVPEFEGKKGHPVYLSRTFCEALAALDPNSDNARLDMQLEGARSIVRLPVNDPNVVKNINTAEEWKVFSSGPA